MPSHPFVTSGIRVGSAAATTRGLDEKNFYEVGRLIAHTVFHAADEKALAENRAKVDAILAAHPLTLGGKKVTKPSYKTMAYFDTEKNSFRCFKIENLICTI